MSERKLIQLKYRVAWYLGTAVSFVLYFTNIISLYNLTRRRRKGGCHAVVLMYHRVCDDGEQPEITVSTGNFNRHMAYLARDLDIVSIDEIIDGYKQGKRWSNDTAAITFDDGFRDNYYDAYPILKKHSAPAAIFVAAGYIGQDFGLSEDEIIAMNKDNITFGAHTMTHPVLSGLDKESAASEIMGSKIELERILNEKVSYFAYPYGKSGRDFNDESVKIVRDCGFSAAFSTDNGFINDDNELFALKRIGMRDFPLYVLKARLSGIFESRLIYVIRKYLRI